MFLYRSFFQLLSRIAILSPLGKCKRVYVDKSDFRLSYIRIEYNLNMLSHKF